MGKHSNLHKDMMEPLNNINPPERCPRRLYSWDSTLEDHNYAQNEKSANLGNYNIGIKEEFKEEDKKYGAMEEHSDGPKDFVEPPNNGNPPETCPRPLYSWDCTQEGHIVPHHHQGEDLINLKIECEVEEEYVWDDQQYTEEAGMTRTFIEEDTPTEISTGHAMEKPSKDRLTLSPGCRMEDEDITGDCGGEKTMISTMDGGLHSVDRPWSPSDSEQPRTVRDGAGIQGEKKISCPDCGKSFNSELSLSVNKRPHKGEGAHSCSECGKSFFTQSDLKTHYRTHTGEKPFTCPECGKGFSQKSCLTRHQKLHRGEKPHACPECGKCFARKSDVVLHRRTHTGERPYSCTECRKRFSCKSSLILHRRTHTGEKPYSCSECGKCFAQRPELVRHQKSHTMDKPFSCPQCGECFSWKACLTKHQKTHTGGY
ncbi:uncharacterized protein LOC143955801 [Lithobates pipiens]